MTRKDGLLALLVVVVWGLNFVVIKMGLHNMPPLMLAGLRFLLVAFPALLFVARPKIPLSLLLGYGLTISFGQFAFLFCAISLGMPAGLASPKRPKWRCPDSKMAMSPRPDTSGPVPSNHPNGTHHEREISWHLHLNRQLTV